ncbi:MAG: hypothetical protein ACLR1V_01180 [Coprococcus sp.]
MPKPITLSAGYSDGVTVIPNTFFDEYLPRANGEFLKIYLYLLRWLFSSGSCPLPERHRRYIFYD